MDGLKPLAVPLQLRSNKHRRLAAYQAALKTYACEHQVLLSTWENGAVAIEMLQYGFGDECLSRARIFKWFKWLK